MNANRQCTGGLRKTTSRLGRVIVSRINKNRQVKASVIASAMNENYEIQLEHYSFSKQDQ